MPVQAMSKVDDEAAVGYVKKYFEELANRRPRHAGCQFETFAGGGDLVEPNRITPADLNAVSMLSIHVPGQAALGIMEELSNKFEVLLGDLAVDLRLQDLDPGQFTRFLDDDSPADRIGQILRQKEDLWGIGQTTASKILARKRPHLILIYDSVIAKQAGMRDIREQWRSWWEAFQGEKGQKSSQRLDAIRTTSGQPHLSLLRVLDIVLWMDRQGAEKSRQTVADDHTRVIPGKEVSDV